MSSILVLYTTPNCGLYRTQNFEQGPPDVKMQNGNPRAAQVERRPLTTFKCILQDSVSLLCCMHNPLLVEPSKEERTTADHLQMPHCSPDGLCSPDLYLCSSHHPRRGFKIYYHILREVISYIQKLFFTPSSAVRRSPY